MHPHSENKDEHKNSSSNLKANSLSTHQNKDTNGKQNNFRMKTNKKPSYLAYNNVAPPHLT